MKILVVDDNASARTFMRRCLEERPHFTVLEAGNTREALEKATDVDLILLDWMLADTKGATFLKPFREGGAKTPVLVVSGLSDRQTVIEAVQLGANGYIRKPFTPQVLLEKVLSYADPSRLDEGKGLRDYEYYLRLAKKRIEEKDPGAALHFLNKSIQMDPHLAGLYKVRADVLASMGRYAEAEKDWKRAE